MVFRVRLENGSIGVPREILRMFGLVNGPEVVISVSGDRIIICPYQGEAPDIDRRIERLRENAPECFSEKETIVGASG